MSKKDKPISPPDALTKTSEKAGIELTESELDQISGGAVDNYLTFNSSDSKHKNP